jgi:hypothetical protein
MHAVLLYLMPFQIFFVASLFGMSLHRVRLLVLVTFCVLTKQVGYFCPHVDFYDVTHVWVKHW